MKTIVTGDINFYNETFINKVLNDNKLLISQIILNSENGIDAIAKEWANKNNIDIALFFQSIHFIKAPTYDSYLDKVLDYADQIIIFWDSYNKSTEKLIHKTNNKDLQVMVIAY